MTDHMIRGSDAPSMRAASSSSDGSARRNPAMMKTAEGRPMAV
jgi:hypothetical protein